MHNKGLSWRRHSCSLRDACRKACLIALTALLCLPSTAQNYPNGLSADSVDPVGDSLMISRMRVRMDSIRRAENRPTVALVLSGGGAKGAAHVGARKFIDETGIPIDMICGTSMGGLMGGLMALGYDTDFLDSLLTHQDWSITLTDKVKPRHIPYFIKQYKSKYLVSVPFHYEKDAFNARIEEQDRYSGEREKQNLHLGAEGNDENMYGSNSFVNSLPAGYVSGFNVNSFLSSLSVGYQDSIDFMTLPTPFFCVATDIISCKAKNFGSGSLKTALRSTMSIPGMFNPVRYQGMILVDGGTRNNFPVDLARAMGADYVIGVNLSDEDPTYSKVNHLGNILGQFIKMLGKDSFDKNVGNCDVFIKPDTRGFNMLSFSPSAIQSLIDKGYDAARSQKDALDELVRITGKDRHAPKARTATNISDNKVFISALEFKGLKDNESRLLVKRTHLKVGRYMGKEDIDAAASRVQATGAFQTVTYSLLGSQEPYKLEFDCEKGPVHQFGLGLRVDNEEWASVAFDIGLNTHKLSGITFDINGKLGESQYLEGLLSYDTPYFPTINLAAKIENERPDILYIDPQTGGLINYKYGFFSHKEMFYLSNINWSRLDFQLGIRNRYFRLWQNSLLSSDTDEYSTPEQTACTHLAAFATGSLYTLDDKYYPTEGIFLNFGYDLDFYKKGIPYYIPQHMAFVNIKGVIPLGSKVALIPDLHVRNLFNSNPIEGNDYVGANDIVNLNYVGGSMPGRYVDHQIPFIGSNDMFMALDHVAVLNMDLRVNPMKNLYISALGGHIKQAGNLNDLLLLNSGFYWAAGLEAGYKTIAGPVKANVHYSTLLKKFEFYFSVGFDF